MTHLFEAETPKYKACMDEIDKLPVEDLRRKLKYVIDSLYGDGDGDPGSPRSIHRGKEWDGGTIESVAEDVEDLAPTDSDENCECGNLATTGGYCDDCFEKCDGCGRSDADLIEGLCPTCKEERK